MAQIKINLIADIVLINGQKRLRFLRPEYYYDQIKRLDDGKKVLITLENQSSKRSLKQSAYWHGSCFPIIAELTGYTEAEAKALCKKMFIKPKILMVKGVEHEVQRGTSELTKYEGVEFTDAVRNLAIELGGYIPTPSEAGFQTDDTPISRKELPVYPSEEYVGVPLI